MLAIVCASTACSDLTPGTALPQSGGRPAGTGLTATARAGDPGGAGSGSAVPPVAPSADTPVLVPSGGQPTGTPAPATTARPGGSTLHQPVTTAGTTIGAPTVGGSGGRVLGTSGGPPSWVRPGARITYYVSAASVAASRFAWVEDPDGPWVDPTTGKHYRRTDESGENVGDGGGDGLSQFDILAVDGDTVIVSDTLYGIDRIDSMFTPGITVGGAVTGPVLDSVWINPETLDQASTQTLPGTMVLRGQYPLGGHTYDAIGFATTDPAAYQSYTYDHDTGLLLIATTKIQGATSPLSAPGDPAPKGNTQLGQTILTGVRQRPTLGLDGSTPAWVGQHPSLAYRGTYTVGNPMAPSSSAMSFPMTLAVTLKPLAGAWYTFEGISTVQVQGLQPAKTTGVAGPTGPFWVDPAALVALKAGQQLDTDPVTGETTTVTATDAGSVTITSAMPGIQTVNTYSRTSGALLSTQTVQVQPGITVSLQLQSAP